LKSSFEFFNLNSSWSIYRKIYAFSGSSRISKILFRQQKTHSLATVGFYFGGGEPKNSHLSIYVVARVRGEERN